MNNKYPYYNNPHYLSILYYIKKGINTPTEIYKVDLRKRSRSVIYRHLKELENDGFLKLNRGNRFNVCIFNLTISGKKLIELNSQYKKLRNDYQNEERMIAWKFRLLTKIAKDNKIVLNTKKGG